MNIKIYIRLAFFLLFSFFVVVSFAQVRKITGFVKDRQSDEPIPFASVVLKIYGRGALTDSTGKFTLELNKWNPNDTLRILSVGYKIVSIPASSVKDTMIIKLEVLPPVNDVTVKVKYNRALWFWKKIMKKKSQHDRSNWSEFSYELYNKLELDLENFNKNKIASIKLIKPLDFVFNYIDSSSEEKPFLPVYLTETLSDYYYQKNPHRVREVIKASKTVGIDNETIVKQLGGIYQNIDIYANFIPVFDKQFISPFNDNGSSYYNFKLLDTQYLDKKRLVHLRFIPKHKGTDVFEGDCWVHDTSFSVQKITLRPSVDANINFISGLSLIQEFRQVNDTTWFLYKDKFVADISPIGNSKLSFKGRKTTTYKNYQFNDSSILRKLDEAKKSEEVDLNSDASLATDSFWQKNRHETLSKTEQSVYKLIDTLQRNPVFISYRNKAEFLIRGIEDVGNFRIGPWYYWLSANDWEGVRTRFDIETNKDFDKHWNFKTYLAYGFGDHKLKGRGEIRYEFARIPYSYISGSYRNDLDNGQTYTDQLGTDNVFATIFRRPNIPYKFQRSEEKKLEYYAETNQGLGFGITINSKKYESLLNLPSSSLYPSVNGNDPFSNFETTLRIRYAYLERTVSTNFDRYSLGSDYPIIELKYTHGWPNVFKSNYKYDKLDFSLSDFLKIPPYGTIYYNLFAGKIFGTVPFQYLNNLPGNELYYYNRYAFNLLNRFEYITDQYVGANIEHNIGNGLFRYIPLTRKWKFRQFWTFKCIAGNLSDANKQLNFVGNYPYHSLNGSTYSEIGTGVDNIFKFFRIDCLWRLSPQQNTGVAPNKFGVFASFRVSF